MALEVTKECLACGVAAVFGIPDEGTIWDHFAPCRTCAGIHYVCRPCLGRLDLLDVRLSQLPCFGSDEFRVAAAVMRQDAPALRPRTFADVRSALEQAIRKNLPANGWQDFGA